MGLFSDGDSRETLNEIKGLRRELASLLGEVEATREARSLSNEIVDLKEKISKLTIEKSKIEEEQGRKEREVRHEIGLLRRQLEQDEENAETRQEIEKDRAILEVQQENLSADKTRFEEQMKFQEERFTKEVGYLKDILGQILDRLPTVTVDATRPAPTKEA